MLVGEMMTRPALTVRDNARPEVAVHLPAKQRLTMLPVVDAENHLVGVVSEADLVGLPELPDPRAHLRPVSSAPPAQGPARVAELISGPPQTTSEQADVAELFRRTSSKSLPVMGDLQPAWEAAVTDGVVTVVGPGPGPGPGADRAAEAAASLAATVAGVRAVHVGEHHESDRASAGTSADAPPAQPAASWVPSPSSGSGVDEL